MTRTANPTGVVAFTCDDVEYRLLYTIDRICQLEDKLELPISDILARVQTRPRMSLLRTVLHAGLQQHHPALTEVEAGELFRAYGAEALGNKLSKAFEAAFGIADTEAGEAEARPPEAAPAA